jgi:hypothetical protein
MPIIKLYIYIERERERERDREGEREGLFYMFSYSPLNSTFLQSTTFETANAAYCDHPADTAHLFTYPHNTPNYTFIYVFSVL